MGPVTWQGTDPEFARLLQAADRNCECVRGMYGLPPRPCPPHEMLKSQSALDHLLYVYRTRKLFITRELYAFPPNDQPDVPRRSRRIAKSAHS
jgi:hypothetical protein